MIFQSVNKILMGGGKSNYRSDIDGLRAIACLSVVIYHAFPTVLIGGFTGVDIFFVISGFLISSILFRELANPQNPGKINIIDFYIRRIRRIFPALIAVLITCLALGYFVLFPDEYALLGKHTAGGAVYINNILLYKESGNYFDVAANAKPLLHLWSLGVEEQFYLIFPLILWAIYRFNINFVFGLTVFTVISFICNKNAINHSNQTAAFFLPQFRFWELSIGAILAYIVEYHKVFVDKFKQFTKEILIKKICLRDSNIVIKDSTLNNILSIIGLLLIIMAILTVKQNLKFPGTKALIPVFGALFIIAAGKDSFINQKILSNKIMVFLGLISYPLYLWHWPLLSFVYICSGQTPEVWVRITAICFALVLSIITFILIEPPLRYGKHSSLKAFFLFLTLLVIGCTGYYIYKNEGIKSRLEINKINNIIYNDSKLSFHEQFYGGREVVDNKYKIEPDNILHFGHIKGNPEFLITGDSYAWQYMPFFEKNIPYARITGSGMLCYKNLCHDSKGEKQKKQYQNLITTLNSTNINTIVIAHNFKDYQQVFGSKYFEKLSKSFIYLADTYKNKKFIIISQVNNNTIEPSSCISPYKKMTLRLILESPLSKKSCKKEYTLPVNDKIQETHLELMKIVQKRENLYLIDAKTPICHKNLCRIWLDNGAPIYSDSGHLSIWGKNIIGQYILDQIRIIKQTTQNL